MKHYHIKLVCLFLSINIFWSCQNDDDSTIDPTVIIPDDMLDINAIIEVITTNSSNGIWEIEQATIITSNNNTTEITDSYTVEDDIFTFTEGSNQTINLRWKKGFDVNMQAQSLQEAGTDRNVSSENFILTIGLDTGIFSSVDERISGNFVQESGEILLIIEDVNSNNVLSLNLSPKNQSDYISVPTTLSTPQELFSYTAGVPRLGFKISHSQNSLYITNRNDLVQFQQLGFKYNLDTNVLTSLDFIQADFATKNIEFLEEKVVSLGGARFQVMDYEFTEVETFIEIDPFSSLIFNGTASLDDKAYIFGGSGFDSNIIATWNLGDVNLQTIGTITSPTNLIFMDGEIVDQVLYIFGGLDTDADQGSDVLYTYHLNSGEQNQIQLPVELGQTYTSTVENLIYVASSVEFNQNPNATRHFGVYNTADNNFQEIDISSLDLILENRTLQQFQVLGNKAYIIVSENLGPANGYKNSVYEATLN